MKSYERREKVAQAIKREIALLIQQGAVKDDRMDSFVSIVSVDLNQSLSSARIMYSVMDGSDDIEHVGTKAALDASAGYMRGVVARRLNLRYAPKLIFIEVSSLSKAVDMVDLIDKTVAKDESHHGEE
ncbi:MAG: 30S ribosome-binding factor RbfA [Candidatus Melainabacteria bacterium]|jgi:ribosome-binding factor A|nr:30S ribosome-binding factor RbfA [Candidatus Melainabacteria bacterium]